MWLIPGVSSIFRTFTKHWLHFIIWIMAGLYLLYSPLLYHHFFVQDGKPVQVMQQPPMETGKIRYNVEVLRYRLNDLRFFNEEIYELRGWTFLNLGEETIQTDFDRFIVLSSLNLSLLFPVETRLRPDVHVAFFEYGMDLNQSGFHVDISKNSISPGMYCIGILFRHSHTGDEYFVNTMRGLVRTPNQVKIEEGRVEDCK